MGQAKWRTVTDRAKVSDWALRAADRLGRGTGRFRFFDRLGSIPAAPFRPDFAGWEGHDLAAVWLGHASVLFRIGGLTVLADPVFSRRIGLGLGFATGGPRRLVSLPCRPSELPAIDLLLVSHAHFDHLDRPTLARLSKSVPVVTSWRNGDLISDLGYQSVKELEVGKSVTVKGLTITATPVNHWGARVFRDSHRGYCAFLMEGGGKRVLFGADSAYTDAWKPLGESGGVDLACIGIGAYDPYVAAHATPEQAAEMARHAGARKVLPMHHSTFRLSHEPMAEPLKRFEAATPAEMIAAKGVGEMWIETPGEGRGTRGATFETAPDEASC